MFFKDYFSSFNIGGIYHLMDVSLHAKEEKCLWTEEKRKFLKSQEQMPNWYDKLLLDILHIWGLDLV